MVNDQEDKHEISHKDVRCREHWPASSDVTAGRGDRKYLTYRSEAEGYENGSFVDDIEILGAERVDLNARNRSLWTGQTGHDQTPNLSTVPTAFFRD